MARVLQQKARLVGTVRMIGLALAAGGRLLAGLLLGLSAVVLGAGNQPGRSGPLPGPEITVRAVSRSELCVTRGAVESLAGSRLSVSVPTMRAVVPTSISQVVEARLTYLGPTSESAPLGSGELRRQFGLKLRAQDGCNVVYVMWRIEPESRLVVSVKRNPGQRTHVECGTHGYRNIKPRRALAVASLQPGNAHTLRAELAGTELRVVADGKIAWEGSLSRELVDFDGPVGMRSDNGRFELELRASVSDPSAGIRPYPCREGSGGEE